MIVRSKAPLRISLAGGGTDLHAYADLHGGGVLNAAIDMNAYATITPRRDDKIVLHAIDRNERVELDAESKLDIDGTLDLAKGVYNRIVKDFHHSAPLAFEMQTSVDAPAGSRLLAGLEPGTRFYFVHSYAALALPMPPSQWMKAPLISWAEHGEPFIAAVENGPLCATQFHPEKSGDAGAALLANWLEMVR